MNQRKIIYFYTDDCLVCRKAAPIMDAAAKRLRGYAEYEKINAAKDKAVQRYGVRSVPTALVTENGREIYRFVGGEEIARAVTGLAMENF